MAKKEIIFEGIAKVGTTPVGTFFQKKNKRDRFGKIYKGEERVCGVDHKYAQLDLPPYKYGNKKIRIIIEIIN